MQVSRFGREVDIACCRSVVKVAIPQRRGSELPMNATRLNWVTIVPLIRCTDHIPFAVNRSSFRRFTSCCFAPAIPILRIMPGEPAAARRWLRDRGSVLAGKPDPADKDFAT